MKKAIFLALVALAGCSSLQTGARNVTAANCASPEAMQAFVSNLPPNPFVNGAQELAIHQQWCHAVFGDVAGPPTAPGNQPMIPGAAATPFVMPPGQPVLTIPMSH